MSTSTSTQATFSPPHPDLRVEARLAAGGLIALLAVWLAWGLLRDVLVATAFPTPPPPAPDFGALAVPAGIVLAAAAVAAIVRKVRYRRALEAQRVYASIARVARMNPGEDARKAMVVHAHSGSTPTEVTLRMDKEAARKAATDALRVAFADATGVPQRAVHMAVVRRGVQLRAEDGAHASTPATLLADPEPEEPPVPARPSPEGLTERIAEALGGVLNTDRVKLDVTQTYDDGYPHEVWLTYPPRLSGSVADSLIRLRSTLQQVAPCRADEWQLRLVGAQCRVVFTDRQDPLAKDTPLPAIEQNPELHTGVVVGITEAGGEWRIPLMGGMHTLVAGASQAGKGSVLWNIVRALQPMIADGRVRLWIVDPKGGAEFSQAEGFAYRFAPSPGRALPLVQELRALMEAKAQMLASQNRRKIEVPTPEEPLDLLIVDELANVTGLAGKLGDEIGDGLAAILSMGRAPAVTVIGALQDPRKETFRHRDLFTTAVALRLRGASETNLILGQGARSAGAVADMIPKKYPGIGYVISDEQADPIRVRTGFVTDDEITRIAGVLAPPLPAPPIGDPVGGAEQPPLDEPRRTRKSPARKARTGRGRSVTVAQLAGLLDEDPLTVLLEEHDPDAVSVTEVEEAGGRWFVTYSYPGESTRREDMDGDMRVTLIT